MSKCAQHAHAHHAHSHHAHAHAHHAHAHHAHAHHAHAHHAHTQPLVPTCVLRRPRLGLFLSSSTIVLKQSVSGCSSCVCSDTGCLNSTSPPSSTSTHPGGSGARKSPSANGSRWYSSSGGCSEICSASARRRTCMHARRSGHNGAAKLARDQRVRKHQAACSAHTKQWRHVDSATQLKWRQMEI
eukprot:4802492-Pleurochrysis_carterae.AAC.1